MSEWFSFEELLDHLQIKDFEIFYHLKEGLQPYLDFGQNQMKCPPECHAYHVEENRLRNEIYPTLRALQRCLKKIEEEKKRKKGKPIYLKIVPIIIDDLFFDEKMTLVKDANKGFLFSHKEIAKLEEWERKYSEEKNKSRQIQEKIVENDEDANSWKYYVEPAADIIDQLLMELKNCIYKKENVEKIEKRPCSILTKENGIDKSAGKKLRPCQIHRLRAREAAKRLWKKDPSITIADMMWQNEIVKCFEGKSYMEKTRRNWIKDLCPNRRPGRRPKK